MKIIQDKLVETDNLFYEVKKVERFYVFMIIIGTILALIGLVIK